MVEEKKETQEKKIVKIKASTGAWWKSTTKETETEDVDVSSGVSKVEEKKKAPRKTTPRKTRPAGRTRKPKTSEVAQVSDGENQAAVVVEEVAVEVAESEKEVTPPRKRGRRSSSSAKNSTRGKSAAKTPAKSKAEDSPAISPSQSPEIVEEQPAAGEENLNASEDKETQTKAQQTDAKAREKKQEDLQDVEPEQAQPAKGQKSEKVQNTPEEVSKVCKLLINAEEPEECRLALLEDGKLESIHVSTIGRTQNKNNIYKARVVAIEPSLQAAFIDYGEEKNGFLPFSEIHPEYYRHELSEEVRQLVETHQWKKIKISDVMEKGQEILAQVVKEEVGKKGANMTTFLSIPGRCVVLMPGSDSNGISRKISGEQRRSQLRDIMTSIDLPEGIGWIVRTASVDITHDALSKDVEYLLGLWGEIKSKGQSMDGVGLVYEDHNNVLRFLREHFDPAIEEILVDDKDALVQVKKFIRMLPENQRKVNVRLHQGARPIFNQYSVEDQIESIYQPQVNLPSGGSIVIDPTEALVAIDVNSGSTSKGKNFEASIFQANMEAAVELARQLRLRDLGGLIVVDFIDMRSKKNIIAVERAVKTAMKRDKAKVDFTRISKFGLMQISRQKLGSPIEAGNYRRCEHCKGRGAVRSIETLSLFYLRRIQTGASRKPVAQVECHFPLDVASYLLNKKRSELSDMERRYGVDITIIAGKSMKPADNEITFHKVEKDVNSKKQA